MSESGDIGRDADWTPPRFELGAPSGSSRVPERPATLKVRPARRPVAARREVAHSRNSATLLALVFLMAAALGLIALAALAMPQVLGVVAVVMGLFVFGALHYILWGWWLGGGTAMPPDDDTSQPDGNSR